MRSKDLTWRVTALEEALEELRVEHRALIASLGDEVGDRARLTPEQMAYGMKLGGGARTMWINPHRIKLAAVGGLSDRRRPEVVRETWMGDTTVVMPGDWDVDEWGTSIRAFDSLPVSECFNDRFLKGREWEETRFYADTLKKLAVRGVVSGIHSEEELRERCRQWDELYADMRDNGYRTQGDLGTGKPVDEIRVGICRNGRFLLFDGRHRLAVAKVLNLTKVPVNVVVRHQDWVDFKDSIKALAERRWKGKIYHLIDHPDLEDVPARHGRNRLDLIVDALPDRDWNGKRLLDLGTHWGFMAHEMEKLGFDCVALEAQAEYADFAERIRVATESRYRVWRGDLTDFPDPRADVVLALSIFHHLLRTERDHERLVAFLGRLSTEIMFFEPHIPNKDGGGMMEGAYRNYGPEEFVEIVSRAAGLPHVERLGVGDRRPLYKLQV